MSDWLDEPSLENRRKATPSRGLKDYEVKAHAFQWFIFGFMAAMILMRILGYIGPLWDIGD